jgi:hypothetical protein
MTNLPSPIDRAAIERIIQRATELQTGERDIADGLSPEEVLALGKEVGIPDRFLRQALLEEQGKANLPAPTGLLDRTLGPGVVSAQRVVQGDVDGLELTLLRWMESEELVEVQRQQPGRITWEPLRPGRATLRRLTSRRPFMLSHASLVAATITSLEPGFCHVSMSADIRPARGSMIIGMSVAGSVGDPGRHVAVSAADHRAPDTWRRDRVDPLPPASPGGGAHPAGSGAGNGSPGAGLGEARPRAAAPRGRPGHRAR